MNMFSPFFFIKFIFGKFYYLKQKGKNKKTPVYYVHIMISSRLIDVTINYELKWFHEDQGIELSL